MDRESFENAVSTMKTKDYLAAERAFKKILDAMNKQDRQYNLIISYLGLAQVLAGNPDGLLLCRDAAGNELLDGDVFLNLAGAEWESMNRKRTIDAIKRGVKIDADNEKLIRACTRLGCRKRCCFNFLPRAHRLNRFFGRLFRRPGEPLTTHHLLFS